LDNRIKAGLIPQLDPSQGVEQFYSDGIHLNESPFTEDPTIGTYVVALTHYATLYQEDPRGLTGSVYGFDDVADAPLLAAVQDAVWDVVSTHHYTGLLPAEPVDDVLYRVNAGGPLVVAIDDGPDWLADTRTDNSDFLLDPGSNRTTTYQPGTIAPGATIAPSSVPSSIFDSQRFDAIGGTNQQYAFDVPEAGDYEVRLYLSNGFTNASEPGQRVFDVALEGIVPSSLDNVDPTAQFGHRVGGIISNEVTVTDGTLNIEFLHGIRNPVVNAIEIVPAA
ncbi:MAG: malectin domain-containing carbohydrate-binding protein, partial [Cyanobacteria bacterium J06641_5]